MFLISMHLHSYSSHAQSNCGCFAFPILKAHYQVVAFLGPRLVASRASRCAPFASRCASRDSGCVSEAFFSVCHRLPLGSQPQIHGTRSTVIGRYNVMRLGHRERPFPIMRWHRGGTVVALTEHPDPDI
jgi:hypothetical protein